MVLDKQAATKEKAMAKAKMLQKAEGAREREWIPKIAEDAEAPITNSPSAGVLRPIIFVRSAKNRGMRITCAISKRW